MSWLKANGILAILSKMSHKTGLSKSGKAKSLQLVDLSKDLSDLAMYVCRAARSPKPSEPFYTYLYRRMYAYSYLYIALCIENSVRVFILLPCSRYCFSKLRLSIFSPHRPLLTCCIPCIFRHFPEQSLLCQALQWFAWDGWGTGWDPAPHLTCTDLSGEGTQAFRRERLPLSCMDSSGCALLSAAYVLKRRIYSTCNIFWEAWLFQAACGSENSFI